MRKKVVLPEKEEKPNNFVVLAIIIAIFGVLLFIALALTLPF